MRRILAAAALAAATALATGCAAEAPAPVSSQVAEYYEANKSLQPLTTRAPVPVAAFIGDSFSAGTGSTDPTLRWTTKTAARLDWVEKNFAVSGTGYLNRAKPEACGKPTCPAYDGAIKDVIAAKPSFVVLSGGRNDVWYEQDAIEARVTSIITSLRKGVPGVKIIITSPLWDELPVPPNMQSVYRAVKAAAEKNKVTYVDLGTPLRGKPELLAPDGYHPNNLGHEAIAATAVRAIKAALK